MVSRTPIPNNTSVWIAGTEYQIVEQIGAGGQSLIYRAKQLENELQKDVVIKEFFPRQGAVRKNGMIVAEKPCDSALFQEQKKSSFERDRFACDVAKKSHQAQYTAYVLDPDQGLSVHPMLPQDCVSLEAVLHSMNDTVDVLSGKFYTDLSRVKKSIAIIKSLLGAVSKIHESGLLHLDLSLGNVFWGETTADGTAYIIDYGSCVENGYNSSTPFWSSAGYAAPELSQTYIKLTPKADLYSVGVIFMLLCCGEKCLENDKPIDLPGLSYRNVKRYTGKLSIPAQAIQALENIIIKATRRDGEDNYETAEDMLREVAFLEKITSDVCISLANNLPSQLPHTLWLPRPDEFKILNSLLTDGAKEIFVFGDGGLGKTEFVVSFAAKHREQYDFYFTTYKGSIRDTVLQLQFDGWESETFDSKTNRLLPKPTQQQYEEKLQLLRSFQSESKVVLIIDNFDAVSDEEIPLEDPDLACLQGLDMQFIFTTRMALQEKNHVEIKSFTTDELMLLMHRHLGNLFKEETEVLEKIIDKVNHNTLLVDLISRLLKNSLLDISPTSVLTALENGKWDNLCEKVSGEYNRDASSKTVLHHLLTLFDLSALSEDARYVLSCAALLPSNGFNSSLFIRCLGEEEKWLNTVSNLRRSGWIYYDRQKAIVSTHTLVREACLYSDSTRPCSQKNHPFIQRTTTLSEDPNLSHPLLEQLLLLFLNTYRIASKALFRFRSHSGWEDHTFGVLFNAVLQTARHCGEFNVAIRVLNAHCRLFAEDETGAKHIPSLALIMAELFFECNAHQEAVNLSEEFLSECPSLRSRFYSIICSSHSLLGNFEESIQAGLSALKYAPEDSINKENATLLAYKNLAGAYSGANNQREALRYTEMYWDCLHMQNPSAEAQIEACLKMSSAYYETKDFEKSLHYAEMIEKQFPKQYFANKSIQIQVNIRLAFAYSIVKNYKKSLEYAERALEIGSILKHPNDPDLQTCHSIIGISCWELGDHKKAAYHLKIVKTILQSSFPEAHPLLQYLVTLIDDLMDQ